MTATALDERALDQLFRRARTISSGRDPWTGEALSDEELRRIYELARLGPTSANSCPARFVFVRSREAKERLRPALDENNVDKTMAAPATVIVAADHGFHEKLAFQCPHADAREWFEGNPESIARTAFRNSSLQGAYLIVAARALGYDCGPMSGFDNARVDAEFFAGTRWKSNFLVNLGRAKPATQHPRNPRLDFAEACRVL